MDDVFYKSLFIFTDLYSVKTITVFETDEHSTKCIGEKFGGSLFFVTKIRYGHELHMDKGRCLAVTRLFETINKVN